VVDGRPEPSHDAKGLLECLFQVALFFATEHAVQIALEVVRVLDVDSSRRSVS
jgi:hypothetical protein